MTEKYPKEAHYIPHQLRAGDFPVVTESVIFGANQVLQAGAVVGVNAEGHYVLSVAAAEDTSKNPVAICYHDIVTDDSPAHGVVQLTGEVLGEQLQLGEGHNVSSVKAALRPLSIFVR